MKTQDLKKIILLPFFLLFSLAVTAQENKLGDFSQLSVVDDVDVILQQSASNSYTLDPADAAVELKLEGSKLVIQRLNNKGAVKVYLNFINLSKISSSGSGVINSDSELKSDMLNLNIVGSGAIKLNLAVNNLNVSIAGSGDVLLWGKAETMNATVAGSGNLSSAKLLVQQANIDVNGSGDATVNVEKSLVAGITGSGDIRYVGNPENRVVNIVGSGSISQTSLSALENDIEIALNNEIKIKMNTGKAPASDTTRLSIGDRKIIIIEDDDKESAEEKSKRKKEKNKDVKHVWAGFELGFCGYSNKLYNTTLTNGGAYSLDYLRSTVINFNPFERNFNLYKNYIALTTGFGFQFNRYMFENNTILVPFKDSIQVVDNNISYTKNMLKASYLTIPLLLQFNTFPKHSKSFHIAVGGQLGIRMGSRSKQVYDVDGSKKRDIYKSNYNLNPFQYGLTARMGYGNFNVFANYNLSELFKKNKGPEVYPFQIGLTLIPW